MPSGRILCGMLVTAMLGLSASGCYRVRSSAGGGQTEVAAQRQADARDVAVPEGYRIEVVATGLTFPTGVTFDAANVPHVVEAGYSDGEVWTTPRLLRIEDGAAKEVASGGNNGPWTGAVFADGVFYVAEGGEMSGGRILKITPAGALDVLVPNLPTMGDHHTNGPALGPDDALYIGLGTATNSGVVGPDNAQFGWLTRKQDFHDIPCRDVKLTGRNFASEDALGKGGKVTTGAFSAYGQPTTPGQIIHGRVPCSGAILRIALGGGAPELIAWGLRNPFGLAFAPSGKLYVTENGYDDRGSRPVWGTADVLWEITSGTWYGWPDFSAGKSLEAEDFQPPGKETPSPLLAEHPNAPPQPAAFLGVHSSSNGFDFSRNPAFGHVGQAFIAQFGDQAPTVGKVLSPVGFKVIRVDVETGVSHDFAVNKAMNGPASKIGGGGLERPVAARFDNEGAALYIVDFGVMRQSKLGSMPIKGTGVLWRVTRGAAK